MASDRELDLVMKLTGDKNDGFLWNCGLTHEIGKLAPKTIQCVKLNIVPIQTGQIVSFTVSWNQINF